MPPKTAAPQLGIGRFGDGGQWYNGRNMRDPSSGSPSVTLDDVTQRFGRRLIFSNVRGGVQQGGVLVITGANGSGKSTLLRIVAGLQHASGGTVTVNVDGRSLNLTDRRPYLGYAAPDLILYRELSGAENLELFARLRGVTLTRDRLVSLLEKVGLRGRGRDYVANYSSGMRQRLKFAFALLHEPPILLLDEPTANLDAEGAVMARSVVDEQRGRGLAIVATNEAREVAWGDSVVTLTAG